MNGNIFTSNGNNFKCYYITHLIISGIIIIFNFILLIEIYWLQRLYYYIYFSLIIFGAFYFLIPIIPFLYVLLKKLNEKKVKIFKALSCIFSSLVLITGLVFTGILMMNAIESNDFCKECPFNLDDSYINKIYDDYLNKNIDGKKLKKECTNRRCIFNNKIIDNSYPNEYMCNYEASKEFETTTKNNQTIDQVICEMTENNDNIIFENENINNFIQMCNSFDKFYICKRISEAKSYALKYDFQCPNENYLVFLIFFCLSGVLLNLIIGFIPWKMEYNNYKKIILSLRQMNQRQGSKSQNTTRNTSEIKKEEVEPSFKKEPTEIIIVYNEAKNNLETEQNLVPREIHNQNNENKKIIINKNKNEIKHNNSHQIQPNVSSKILSNINVKLKKKNNSEKIEKNKKDDNIKVFKINESPVRKKESKKRIEIQEEFITSNSHKISIYSDRNILEESKTVPEV